MKPSLEMPDDKSKISLTTIQRLSQGSTTTLVNPAFPKKDYAAAFSDLQLRYGMNGSPVLQDPHGISKKQSRSQIDVEFIAMAYRRNEGGGIVLRYSREVQGITARRISCRQKSVVSNARCDEAEGNDRYGKSRR